MLVVFVGGFKPGLVGVGERGGGPGMSRLGRVEEVGVRFPPPPPWPEGTRRGGNGAPGSRGEAIVDICALHV